jgi:hypothetical protein
MRREQLGGWSMIAGAVLGLVTMVFHPTDAEQALLNLTVHSIALLTFPVAFYGGWVLTRRLSAAGPLPELALAFYGASAVAGLVAAVASGLLAPDLIARASRLDGDSGAVATDVMRYNFAVNQAFAKMWIVASFAAIGLWSLHIVRTRMMRRTAGLLGCAIAVLVLLALFSGHITLDVHGFGAVVFVQAIWLILVGAELRRTVTAVAESRG